MGKHSISPARKRVFNKTMAVALAAGVSFGGVQIVGPDLGMNVAGVAAADTIPAEYLTLSAKNDAGKDLLKYTPKNINESNKAAFESAFPKGSQVTLHGELKLPDDYSVNAGDQIKIIPDGLSLSSGTPSGDLPLKIDGVTVATLSIAKYSGFLTITLKEEMKNYLGRSAGFDVNYQVSSIQEDSTSYKFTQDESLDGKIASSEKRSQLFGVGVYQQGATNPESSQDKLINEYGVRNDYTFTTKYNYVKPTNPPSGDGTVKPSYDELNKVIAKVTSEPVDLNKGSATLTTYFKRGVGENAYMGYGNIIAPKVSVDTHDTNATMDDVFDDTVSIDKLPEKVTVKYSIDDPHARAVITKPHFQIMPDAVATGKIYNIDGVALDDPNYTNRSRFLKPYLLSRHFEEGQFSPIDVNVKQTSDTSVEVTFDNIKPGYILSHNSLASKEPFAFESPYKVGKKVTLKADSMSPLTDGKLAGSDIELGSASVNMASINGWADGYVPKSGITFEAKVNGNNADDENSAQELDNKSADFTAEFTNNGQIGESSVTVKYPKGVTGPNGETEKTVFFPGGLKPGETETVDLGKLNVPTGVNANEFKAEMTNQMRQDGKPLSDPAWTNYANESAPVDSEPEAPAEDIYIEKVKDVKPDGTVTLHRNDGKDITFKVPTGSKVEVNKDGDLVITNPGEKPKTVKLKHTKIEEKGKPGTPDHKIIITDEDGNTHEFGTYDKYLKSVKDDGKGNYTFTMNDGTKLGPIKLGDDITNIADDGKGNLIVTHKDGSKDTVPLTHTTITEKGKPGDPDYAVTITTPDGKKITLDGYDNYVESIKKQPNGDYLVKRNDGTEWTIKLSDIRNDIKKLKGKDAEQDKRLDDLEDRVDGIDEEITNLGDRITKNEGAIEDHRKSINDLNQEVGSINNELGDIKDELARLDGQDIKEVRDNGDGTYTLIRNNGDEVTGTIDTSGDIKSITDNGDGTITLTKNDGSTEVVDLTHTKVETKGKPGDKDYTVTITTPDGNKVTLNGSNTYPSNVRDNGDGTYTIVLNDGSEVEGKIGDGQDIKELVPNEDGTMTVIHKDGSESKVDLKQVEITEQNKGTPEHTVTITSPNGDTVTFNVFDKYVTNVVKNESGDYDIFRSDVDGGNTVWKTIVLSDLRDKIANLEDRADGLEEKDKDLQKQIDGLKDRLDNAEKEIESLKDRTSDLEKAVAKINARLSVIDMKLTSLGVRMDALEGRVDTVETTQHAWAQCFSGVLGTAIPLLAAVPFIAGSNIQIPGAAQWNNQIQRTLGIYNEKLNRMAGQYSGVIKAAATILGVAGTIGLGVHTAKACGPYSKTDAMKDTKAGKLSSKLTAKREGSSREK